MELVASDEEFKPDQNEQDEVSFIIKKLVNETLKIKALNMIHLRRLKTSTMA